MTCNKSCCSVNLGIGHATESHPADMFIIIVIVVIMSFIITRQYATRPVLRYIQSQTMTLFVHKCYFTRGKSLELNDFSELLTLLLFVVIFLSKNFRKEKIWGPWPDRCPVKFASVYSAYYLVKIQSNVLLGFGISCLLLFL